MKAIDIHDVEGILLELDPGFAQRKDQDCYKAAFDSALRFAGGWRPCALGSIHTAAFGLCLGNPKANVPFRTLERSGCLLRALVHFGADISTNGVLVGCSRRSGSRPTTLVRE